MGPRWPKSAGSQSEASSSRTTAPSTTPPIFGPPPPPQRTVQFTETEDDLNEMDDIVLPPGYDPTDDLSLILNFLYDRYAPGPV